jgi:lysyl-tRNA synthetase class II
MAVYGSNYEITRLDAYEVYKDYCDMIGTEPESKNVFTERMKHTLKIHDSWTRANGKKERAWKGVTFKTVEDTENGTVATANTGVPPLEHFNESKIIEGKEITVPAVPTVAEHTCGQCDLWHKGSCCFPGDPSCVMPTSPYAQDCKSFRVKGELQHG